MNVITSFFTVVAFSSAFASFTVAGPKVVLETSEGNLTIELNEEEAPKTVANFLKYTKEGFYDNTVIHRVIKGFMVQGGGFGVDDEGNVEQKATSDPVENEAKNGLKNEKGSIAMARTSDPHSATAQFFINHGDNTNLDYPSFDGWGYAVFGKVVEGMDVVEKIAKVETGAKDLLAGQGGNTRPQQMSDVPLANVVIKNVKVVE